MPNILFSLFVAVVSTALAVGVFALSPVMFAFAAVIGCILAAFLALPVVLLLKKLNNFNIYTTLFSGFVIGALPFAIWLYPNTSSSIFSTTISDGATVLGWFAFFILTLICGLIGILAATIFWACLCKLESNPH